MYKICLAELIEFQATKIKKFVLLKILCKKYNKKNSRPQMRAAVQEKLNNTISFYRRF